MDKTIDCPRSAILADSAVPMMQICKICQNSERNRLHTVREMAFGVRESFTYLECGKCGCLQLLDIPADMARFYPPNYYSFEKHGALKTFMRHQWSSYAYGHTNPIGWALTNFLFSNNALRAVRRAGAGKDARILDVGCGSGRLLLDMAYLGFRNLTGADPFISQDIVYDNGVKVFKKELGEMPAGFDFIMLNHSFEHMDKPAEVMHHAAQLLSAEGRIILRIPVASSYAWQRYGVNWVNLDAPRHFYLHTTKSIEHLAQGANLLIEELVHEGGDDQFWGSEQFEAGMASNDPRSFARPIQRLMHWNKVRAWKAKAEELNRQGQGDMACFRLRKAA